MKYKGLPVNKGIVIGRIRERSAVINESAVPVEVDTDLERMRFFDALLEYEGDMKKIAASASSKEGRDIISGQIMIARDPVLSDEIIRLIDSGMWAGEALDEACGKYEQMLRSSGDETIIDRVDDLLEVKNGIRRKLFENGEEETIPVQNDGDVIFAERLTAAEIIGLKDQQINAVVMKTGTATSHAAVILRSMGITAVFGVNFNPEKTMPGSECIVDGTRGIVIVLPTAEERSAYRKVMDLTGTESEAGSETFITASTMDGAAVDVLCNLGFDDVPGTASLSDGAGLVRTEFLFMNSGTSPSEKEQEEIYSGIIDAFEGKPVVIRTLDAGGDKNDGPTDERAKGEENPALGIRGLRISLKDADAFRVQVRAILRASEGRNVSILVPMVSTLSEIRKVRQLIEECRSELASKKIGYKPDIKLGCMIETPAAVLCADMIAGAVDFFSIGTNDLSQYIMCADRGNPDMADLCSIHQPAVLRAVKRIVDCAEAAGIPVTICGEAASYPEMLPVFLGLGVRSLSVDPQKVSDVKKAVCKLNIWSCRELADMVMKAESKEAIEKIII